MAISVTSISNRARAFIGGVGLVGLIALGEGAFVSGQGGSCGMQLNTSPAIFCDTFDQPYPVTNRSGQLNGTVWGVSRLAGGTYRWMPSLIAGCNGNIPVAPPNDVIVCNGQLRQSTDDGGNVTVLALYPKQPFDFTNRTGTVAFDVTNDTSGSHGAWPEFWLTDLPVPAPFTHSAPCDFCSVPRHGLGIRFAADRGECPGGWRADSVVVVRNYVVEDKGIFDPSTSGTQIRQTGCASLSSGPNGGMNHIELRISQNQIDVYASDAGTRTPLRRINTITNANLTLTRGLIWIEDAHYNASKSVDPSHGNHTFSWDNVAFDGPPTYRDISYDVLDRNAPGFNGGINLGWDTTPSNPVQLMTLPFEAQYLNAATRAILMFNYEGGVTSFNYSINGHAVSAPSPVPPPLHGWRSVTFDVPKSQLVVGPQNIVLSGNTPFIVQNVNIVLVNAAPVPGVSPPPSTPSNLKIMTDLLKFGFYNLFERL
jgi:hypothetical protein